MTLRNGDVIVMSLKNAIFASRVRGKRDRQYFGHNFDKFKDIVATFCKEYCDEWETTDTTKVRLT